ncbi:hypothetical protein K6119_02545 [Paracrocinitomix mangrovi]|uniref:hypothetical protein n=1 Tax=Paracrocinitomix mangrovi TaxID=2862509 RepID=UPI001C8F0971|nr:hypothetical protein [Paracrocinitomix mangrovi]UKN02398.1 hypothetical protein K6119_02545 [Paracrocinitomix mangrovi]
MSNTVNIEQGEIYIKFNSPTTGKLSLKSLGLNENYKIEGGFLRIVFDFEGIGEHDYFKVPTIEIEYDQEVPETHWQCDFNEETILDKTDHYGHSTVILLNRDKIASLEHHHQNKLVLHAEFPEEVNLLTEKSMVNFFK